MTEAPDPSHRYEPIALTDESTVVAAYVPDPHTATGYQSEADLESEFIAQLVSQAYEYLPITSDAELIVNLRAQLEGLNKVEFSDTEWDRFFAASVAGANEGIVEKAVRIQTDHVQVLKRDDGTVKNIYLLDKQSVHNNRLQVINQYEVAGESAAGGRRDNRYDVTVLVNGLPLVHVELKRRGVDVREAFNQINRYQRDSFWSGSGLFEYVQLFVISNGTQTKYYSNTTRKRHEEQQRPGRRRGRQTSNTFEFTSWWADAANNRIADLIGFTKTFFAKHTLLNILTKYCVLDVEHNLLVMRSYQIAATERILQRIITSTNSKTLGGTGAGGYVWHTTGSGKTLTSFKTAQLASRVVGVDKVMFVVDRKDLDYQTMREYDRFERGAVDGTTNTSHLRRRLEDPDSRIIVTTIQKLSRFIAQARARAGGHEIFSGHLVIIFDECHRSQFGDMHLSITRAFKRYHLFGFTGTPIFADNAGGVGRGGPGQDNRAALRTTEQAFGDKLHSYTIVDAIHDKNVLPFRVDTVNTIKLPPELDAKQVSGINTEEALLAPERLRQVVEYILDHFDQKTRRSQHYTLGEKRVSGFNSMFASASIEAARKYYDEFARQQRDRIAANPAYQPLKVGIIFSYDPNEEESTEEQASGVLGEEALDTTSLDATSREFLDRAIADFNATFGTSYDTSGDQFQNYYKDLAGRFKSREVDLVIVVNMFLTGFDATTLNTLWVDKNLRQHGLIQAFSRTNRVLNSVKTYGSIVCFRDLTKATDDALTLFGNKDAKGIVLLKPYPVYFEEYAKRVAELRDRFTLGLDIVGEANQKQFIGLFGGILNLLNVLVSFDEFAESKILTDRELQDYHSVYLELYREFRKDAEAEKESILDDVVFEIELIKQVEVNVDYILLLVEKWRDARGQGLGGERDTLKDITRAVESSPSLRNKSDLIMEFVDSISITGDTGEDWQIFVRSKLTEELERLVADEGLDPDQTRSLVDAAFRDGYLPTAGMAITRILPPMSRFAANNDHAIKRDRVIAKLSEFFERFSGLLKP